MVEVIYVWHDCFVVRSESSSLVFDFWKDPLSEGDPLFLDRLDPSKPLYVFVSHHHKDHLNRDIFGWISRFPEIYFILSKDTVRMCRHILSPSSVYKGPKPERDRYTELKPGMEFSTDALHVRAFGSTDIGNSYVVECDGLRIFHAGDLNAWVWTEDSTPGEIRMAINNFQAKLNEIKKYLQTAEDGGEIDICMFPVDSRIGGKYYTGAKMFLEQVYVKRFFPMHFGLGDDAERERHRLDAARFDLYANPSRGECIALQAPYSSYSSSVAVFRAE